MTWILDTRITFIIILILAFLLIMIILGNEGAVMIWILDILITFIIILILAFLLIMIILGMIDFMEWMHYQHFKCITECADIVGCWC